MSEFELRPFRELSNTMRLIVASNRSLEAGPIRSQWREDSLAAEPCEQTPTHEPLSTRSTSAVNQHIGLKFFNLATSESNWDLDFSACLNSNRSECKLKGFLINRFEKTMTQFVVDVEKHTDNLTRQFLVFKSAFIGVRLRPPS